MEYYCIPPRPLKPCRPFHIAIVVKNEVVVSKSAIPFFETPLTWEHEHAIWGVPFRRALKESTLTHNSEIKTMACFNHRIVTCDEKHTVRVWNLETNTYQDYLNVNVWKFMEWTNHIIGILRKVN